jgi:hypothetical protein
MSDSQLEQLAEMVAALPKDASYPTKLMSIISDCTGADLPKLVAILAAKGTEYMQRAGELITGHVYGGDLLPLAEAAEKKGLREHAAALRRLARSVPADEPCHEVENWPRVAREASPIRSWCKNS